MRGALKGSTVMALTSWSYRGKSGRECSAAGSTDNERVCWSGRRSPRGRQSFVDFSRGWWRSYPRSSLWVFAAARRATCQVPGLSSNFHGCAEITKSQGPGFPFDRLQENPGYLQVLAFSVLLSRDSCPGGFWWCYPSRLLSSYGAGTEFCGDISRASAAREESFPTSQARSPNCLGWGERPLIYVSAHCQRFGRWDRAHFILRFGLLCDRWWTGALPVHATCPDLPAPPTPSNGGSRRGKGRGIGRHGAQPRNTHQGNQDEIRRPCWSGGSWGSFQQGHRGDGVQPGKLIMKARNRPWMDGWMHRHAALLNVRLDLTHGGRWHAKPKCLLTSPRPKLLLLVCLWSYVWKGSAALSIVMSQ